MFKIARHKLEIAVFICGAMTMILELAGSRVVAPYFGNSLYVWTGLIGVILGCMSLGYYFGGYVADKKEASIESLSFIVLLSGLLVAFSAFIKDPLLNGISNVLNGIEISSLLSVFLLFGPVSFLLAMVTPYAAKIKLKELDLTGEIVGRISSLSTLGSIVGTFSAGFFLIPFFGNRNLMYLLSLTLMLLAIFLNKKMRFIQLFFVVILVVLFCTSTYGGLNKIPAIADIDTQYNRIIVGRAEESSGQDIITMRTDNSGIQTEVYADGSNDLIAEYLSFFNNSKIINPGLKKVLMIGGAGYSFPRNFLSQNKSAQIDVVEIDPKMTDIATKYFFFNKNESGLDIINKDARVYARSLARDDSMTKYDTVLLDAFNSITPPYYLTTKEFFADLKNTLNENGFVMINMISSFEGENSQFLKSEYATLETVFPKVRVYPIAEKNLYSIQNISVVAYKSSESDLPLNNYELQANGAKILTDDNAPVEQQTRSFNLASK